MSASFEHSTGQETVSARFKDFVLNHSAEIPGFIDGEIVRQGIWSVGFPLKLLPFSDLPPINTVTFQSIAVFDKPGDEVRADKRRYYSEWGDLDSEFFEDTKYQKYHRDSTLPESIDTGVRVLEINFNHDGESCVTVCRNSNGALEIIGFIEDAGPLEGDQAAAILDELQRLESTGEMVALSLGM